MHLFVYNVFLWSNAGVFAKGCITWSYLISSKHYIILVIQGVGVACVCKFIYGTYIPFRVLWSPG